MDKGLKTKTGITFLTAIVIFFGGFVGEAFAQIGPSGNNFTTQTLTNQDNSSFLHNTVNDQCCFERLDGTAVDRGLTPNLFGFRAGFDQDGVDFRGDDNTHRGCIGDICFSIPAMHAGADTQFGNGVPVGSSESVLPFQLQSNLTVSEQLVATDGGGGFGGGFGGGNSSAPFNVDFSISHSQALFSRPDPNGSGNRLNTIVFAFDQSVQSGVPGGSRGGPISFLNGDNRDSGEGSGCDFCGDQGERVARQQDFGMSFTILSTTDSNGNMLGTATGTFQQTLTMSDVLAPNNTASCGTTCIGQMGPVTIGGAFTFDGTFVNITTDSIDINGVPQTVGSTDPLGVPTNQTIAVP